MNIVPAGDHALLVELAREIPAGELHAAASRVRAMGVLACIVGHSSLYVIFEHEPDEEGVAQTLLSVPAQSRVPEPRQHRIPVSFDGSEFGEFLQRIRLSRDEFFERIPTLTVRYLGFHGGFAYLDGWPAEWAMPRRPSARPVARGSFAIAAAVAGFYPLDSPGGWNILGRTTEPLEYRFAPADEILVTPVSHEPIHEPRPETRGPRPGFPGIEAPLMTIVRAANWANLERGMPVGGPFDVEAAQAANIAVGNPPGRALLEFAQVGPRITPDSNAMLAWYDASGGRIYRARRDETIDIGRIRNGLRGYLAIGSAATGGGAPLRRDDRFVIRAKRGPHDIGLDEIECEVTSSLDRVGIRMRPLTRIEVKPPADLPSLGMQFGSLQLHPDGSIVAMGPEHPVTGGYLQPMTVLWSERWKLAHLAPGERVRFVAQSP